MDEKTYKRHCKADFTLLASMWMPDADSEGLRVMSDWLTWVFYFDDREFQPSNPDYAKILMN
jgi:hypothetical protein